MTDFEKMLDDVVQGKSSLAPLRTWLDKKLKQRDCDPEALYAALDSAQKAGLAQPAAMALRKQIDAVFGVKPPTNENKEQSRTITSVTITRTDTRPETTGQAPTTTSPFEHTKTDTDRTLTSPISDQHADTASQSDEDIRVTGMYEQRTVMLNTTGNTGSDRTITGKSASSRPIADDYDPFSTDVTSAASPSEPTSTSWHAKSVKKDKSSLVKIGTGAVLKERFELVNVLGEGGMGKVFRARDLLKVEAKDKNPFIAVKTLSGDFREHPEAFMALQREASKAQRLAHPNIATVFDFDRDGTTIYLTMELMEGEELSSFIKRLPAGGLPVPEAMNLIKQLCDGLAYAHSKGLVHSDFKPGNAFITTEGTVKLLDFGIARASKTRKDATGVTTIFDPSELGALTPAYASLEMFEGDDPDPRDDIYALACVGYELLTGKHPFNKLSAPKVLEKGLRPASIAKLSKRQNRALLNALTITRDERTPTVEKFWDELCPRKNRILQYGPIVAAILAIFILLGYRPVENYFNARRNDNIVSRIQSRNVDIPSVLRLISGYDPESQRYILDNGKDKIIKFYEAQAEAFVDEGHGQYNYPAAFDEISKVSSLYPDSAELSQEKSSLMSRRANLLADLTTKFNQRLAADQILPGNEASITDVIRILRIADPNDSLLHDERLTNRYAQLVQKDVVAKNYTIANRVLAAGLDYSPDDAELLNLQDLVQQSLRQQRDGPRIAQLETLLRSAMPNLHSLDVFDKVRSEMLELSKLNPLDPVFIQLNTSLKSALQTTLRTETSAKDWGKMEKTLFDYSPLLSIDDVLTLRSALTQSEANSSFAPIDMQSRLQKIRDHRSTITQMLANPKFDSDWDYRLMSLTRETAALLQSNDLGWFKELRENIANKYISLAQGMIKQSRFEAATGLLAQGRSYAPQFPGFMQADQELADARQNFKQAQAERLRKAQIMALKNQFQTQLNAGQITEARKTYLNLQNQLPADDKFLTTEAPQAYAGAYLNLAKARAAIGDYRGAIALVQGGLQYASLDSLKKALQDYSAQAERDDLMARVANLQPDGIDALKIKLTNVQKLFPGESLQIADELYRILAQHIITLKAIDLGLANALLTSAKSAFPQSVVIRNIVLPPAPVLSRYAKLGREAMAQNELSKADTDLVQGQQAEPGNQDLAQFATQLQAAQANANRYFVAYQDYMRAGQSQQAKTYLAEAIRLWADNPAFQAEYQRNFTNSQIQIVSPNGGQPCTVELAGYGRQGRAECFDFLGKGLQGPTMVVVPAGGGFKQSFAIGKYEVSVGQVNAYCHATGQCKPLPGENNMPATNLPFSEVKNYVAWLSARSKEHYFIPSYIQYRYAASVSGTDTNQDFNCQVTLAGQVIKGLSMVSVETGRPNIWGLVNYVGNVNEWVLGADGLEAVGGDYRDPLSQCSVDLVRSSNGAADPLTGFRVGRFLDK
ncbi:MAG TPA: protein kinase [Gammaproteobacteria bacterium]|nr:protein kinase [Gammaproteobacteria bacterium]